MTSPNEVNCGTFEHSISLEPPGTNYEKAITHQKFTISTIKVQSSK